MNEAEVVFDNSPVGQGTLALRPGVNLRTGEDNLRTAFGSLTSLEKDLLIVASSIFTCDLAFKRGERENVIRQIKLKIPVVNHALLNSVRREIIFAIYLLSHDAWDIEFTLSQGTPETNKTWVQESDSKVLLFSGGLDSFAAAVNLGYSREQIHLISHLTGNQNIYRSQKLLFEYLETNFANQFTRTSVRVGGVNKISEGYPFPTDQAREESQRTRSFLFLTLAGIAARRLGVKDVIMIAENGQLAIHLPLTAARISAFSTHTAHPEFVEIMTRILRSVLSFNIHIYNPFLYVTKAEVVKTIKGNEVAMIPTTISCWMSARLTGGYSHCGECIPCIIRRIATESNGIKINEYNKDILSKDIANLDPNDRGKRNFVELAEFVKIFQSTSSQAQIINSYPELINDSFDTGKAIDMYRRFALEANQVFSTYPNLTSIVR